MRALALLAILLVLVPGALLAHAAAPAPAGHVFVIVLENKGFNRTFGPSAGSPYLAQTLTSEGVLFPQYYGTGHSSLDNYVAMVSGQPPIIEQQADCPIYHDAVGAIDPLDGQFIGQGCVFPASVPSIGTELSAAGISWRQYAEDMAALPGAPTACRHPALNSQDPWEGGRANENYATKHVGTMYFHGIIDDAAFCAAHNVDLQLLATDLQSEATTPALALISPNLCSDGHDSPCANASQPGGYAGIDAFLRAWIPRIQASPAYQHNGAIVVTFDEGDDNGSCCGEAQSPDTLNNAGASSPGMGGGQVGAVLLTPCAIGGSVDATPLNHYALLRSIEDNAGVPRLANAAAPGLHDMPLGC